VTKFGEQCGTTDEVEISIIAPFYNEESNVDFFCNRLINELIKLKINYEIICIDDGSRDNTFEKLIYFNRLYPQVKVVSLARNFGKEIALTAGLQYSRGKAVIPIDSDLQDPPEVIKDLILKWREGYDMVYAIRHERKGETFIKRLTANLFYRIINFFSDIPIPKNTGDFRLIDRRAVNALNAMPERTRFMKGLFAWVGFKQIGIEYDREPRRSGQTKWKYWKLWNFALDGIALFSTIPLRFWSYLGLSISMLSFFYGFFLIILVIVHGKDVPGYASTMVAILFLGGLQLTSLGILGEYIGRIYAEVKQRPLFIVNKTYGINSKEEVVSCGEDNLPEECQA
jgi:glycosyltransferase involved in cell wall biosynthesis